MTEKYDAIIVLGKNVGYFGSRGKIRKSKNFLSKRSELNVMAAGLLFEAGFTNTLIFCGGKTAGKDFPSEAEAMKNFLKKKFLNIPPSSIILEDKSLDTKQNVEFAKELIKNQKLIKVAFLTSSAHIKRSKMLFKKFGLNLKAISTQDVVRKYSPEIMSEYKNEYEFEKLLEGFAYALQSIPKIYQLTNFVIERRRGRN